MSPFCPQGTPAPHGRGISLDISLSVHVSMSCPQLPVPPSQTGPRFPLLCPPLIFIWGLRGPEKATDVLKAVGLEHRSLDSHPSVRSAGEQDGVGLGQQGAGPLSGAAGSGVREAGVYLQPCFCSLSLCGERCCKLRFYGVGQANPGPRREDGVCLSAWKVPPAPHLFTGRPGRSFMRFHWPS